MIEPHQIGAYAKDSEVRYPRVYACLNKRCREFGEYPLCPSCRLAGRYGIYLATLVGIALKLLGVL